MTVSGAMWGLVVAAGKGSRMRSELPKQYLQLAGRSVLGQTLLRFGSWPGLSGLVVVLDPADAWWPELEPGLRAALPIPLHIAPGGAERSDSVRSGLRVLADIADPDDWVLVHDAARPCLRHEDLDALVAALSEHPVGGILALPVVDTIKRVDAAGDITATVDREQLWRAATPQVFRLQPLADALDGAVSQGQAITDDASAMELAGLAPRIVECHSDNIKITHPADLELAEMYLRRQQQEP